MEIAPNNKRRLDDVIGKLQQQRKRKKCPHGKEKCKCKDYGGSSLCEHGKEKCKYKDCGGSSICEHRIQNSICKKCGGSSICEHRKRKSICTDCDGSLICRGYLTTQAKCGSLGNPKYDMHCTHCFKNIFKDDPHVANIHTNSKEIMWVIEILTNIPLDG